MSGRSLAVLLAAVLTAAPAAAQRKTLQAPTASAARAIPALPAPASGVPTSARAAAGAIATAPALAPALAAAAASSPPGAAGAGAPAAAVDGAAFDNARRYGAARELRLVLADGTDGPGGEVQPFSFVVRGWGFPARSAGLEGFLYSKLELEGSFGPDALAGQLPDYFRYLHALLVHPWTGNLRERLRALESAPLDDRAKSAELNRLLTVAVKAYRRALGRLDASQWLRESNVYMIFARAYNRPKPGHSFFDALDDAELDRIRETTKADTIWLLDIWEIGELRRWGTGGGSSYAIKGYRAKAELGGDEALKRFIARARARGFKVGVDQIPNHVSIDSDLVKYHPEAILHIVPPQDLPDERIVRESPHHQGGPVFELVHTGDTPRNPAYRRKKLLLQHPRTEYADGMWNDMVQRDISVSVAWDWEASEMERLVRDLGVEFVRRDMAHYVERDNYFGRWREYLRRQRDGSQGWARAELERLLADFEKRRAEIGDGQFLERTTRAMRLANARVAVIDEVYSQERQVSRSGSNGLYNKTDLYDAWVSGSPRRIRDALRNAAFRLFQKGGAASVNFIGTHDGGEGNPFDKFGPLAKPIAAIALLLRPTLTFNGVEQGVGQDRNVIGELHKSTDRQKAIPMDIPVAIDWTQADPANREFLKLVWAKAHEYRRAIARGASYVLEPRHETPIQTFLASGFDENGRRRTLLAAANVGHGRAAAVFDFPAAPVLRSFGAFRIRRDRSYALTDAASGRTYLRSGAELLKDGLFVELDGAGVHLFDVEERP